MGIFSGNHRVCICNQGDEAVSDVDCRRLEGRSLILGNGSDTCLISRELVPSARKLLSLLKELGLEVPADLIGIPGESSNIAVRVLKMVEKGDLRTTGDTLFPFIHSFRTDRIAELLHLGTLSNAEIVEFVSDKVLAREGLSQVGNINIPPYFSISSYDDALSAFNELRKMGYKSMGLKTRRGVSGLGVFQVSTEDELKNVYEKIDKTYGIFMDGWLEKAISFPNIQYTIGDTEEEDKHVCSTVQILEGSVHKGNENNPEFISQISGLDEQVRIMRNWLRNTGFRGIVGIDMAIVSDGGKYSAHFMEFNARVNGSTPAAVAVSKAGIDPVSSLWSCHNGVYVPHQRSISAYLASLRKNNMLFDGKSGIIPLNLSNILENGTVMMAIIGENEQDLRIKQQIVGV